MNQSRGSQAGYNKMSVQVFSQNISAVRLYERLGYHEVARAPVREHPCQPYYDEDVILLLKRQHPQVSNRPTQRR